MSLMKIHRSNESFWRWLLLFMALATMLLTLVETTSATESEAQTNATTNLATTNGANRQQQQQQKPKAVANTTTTTATTVTTANQKQNAGGEKQEAGNSAEILSVSEVDVVAEKPTTYRPSGSNRPSTAPQNSAQDRERKLMNVLAARRSALHRGGFRTRIGTTGRSATSPAAAATIESTSKSPTDPRSVCIRNCTKNFTRRTTASCMRQCANFTRMAAAAAASANIEGGSNKSTNVVVRPSSKGGNGSGGAGAGAGERDTNEILLSDESSHGLFVVAKEQNDTLNHIPDATKSASIAGGVKQRQRGKPAVTVAPSSVEEDDELQPYVYFGAKLPPIKPDALTITEVDRENEHPRVLEISVSMQDRTTTSTTTEASTLKPTVSTRRPLSAVERSRSRYKYHMRERGLAATPPPAAPAPPPISRTRYTGSGRPTIGLGESSVELKQTDVALSKPTVVRRVPAKPAVVSSTPLIITVLSAEEETASLPAEIQPPEASTTTTCTSSTEKPTTTTRRSTTTITSTTTSTSTSTSTSTESTSTKTTTTERSTIPTTTTPSSHISTSTATNPNTGKRKTIIEEDTERLRALGPSLTQEINIEDQKNLIIFCNNTVDCGSTPRTQVSHTTDSNSKILRTTVLTSVRSTVHPRTSTSTPAAPSKIFVGVVETTKDDLAAGVQWVTVSAPTNLDISSTAVSNERDVDMEMRRMNLVTLVLVAVGVIPLAAIILYLVRNYVVRRRAKHNEVFDVCITDQQPISPVKKVDSKYHLDEEDEVDHQHMHPQSQPKCMTQSRDANHNHRYVDDKSSLTSEFQEFERSNIRLKSLLGEGNFGQVWKAEADDLSGHFGATRIVAVKTIRACSAQVSLKDEANIMRKLGSHQNVVTLLGACVESEPHMLIMEYAMRGRLLSLLRAARSATNILPASVPGGRSLAPLSPRTLAGFALDIACGMEYIAERRIVHRDLAARNVLLDHNGMCKICDFGMSLDLDAERLRKEQEKNAANDMLHSNAHKFRFDFGSRYILQHWQHTFGQGHSQTHGHCSKEHSEKKAHGGQDTIGKKHALPIRWMAPESLQLHLFTTETDIWAFGIVLWEIATLGSTPYSHLTGREVIRRVPQGLRPDLPKESRHEFYNLMSRCWHKDPHMRPSFSQSRLEITRSLHKWVDDDSAASDYMDVSGFSEDLEHGVVYFNHRISEFECEI
ncbi:flocculation protein FLO11 [Scaptodrosophila lebanonensis]|uniref:Flocculation protein FLO11 n=1 Tax=Drosophila lebanonensis TaxID=7225 RepID=A0A6J2T9F6_DROLE|nr:flocculation protein FLO11 [Scaptodrosophila lebanonensis]